MTGPQFYIDDTRLDFYPFGVNRGENTVDLGTPETVTQILATLQVDGDEVASSRTGNRTLAVPMTVEGVDLDDLAANEATLILLAQSASTFTLVPGTGAAPTVFDVRFGSPTPAKRNDDYESALIREWTITLTCYPWPRPESVTTATFSPGAGTVTTLDNGSSTSSWAQVAGSPAPATGTYGGDAAIKLDPGVYSDQITFPGKIVGVDWTGTVGSSSDYLVLDWASETGGAQPRLGATWGAGALPVAIMASPLGASYIRSIFVNPGGTPRFWLTAGWSDPSTHDPVRLWIGNLGKTTGLPAGGLFSIGVGGTQRAPASLRATMGTGTMSALAAYFDPTLSSYGWQPNVSTSWPMAPRGRYMAYVTGHGVALGSPLTVQATFPDGSVRIERTLVSASATGALGDPVGEFVLGGQLDGRVGAVAWQINAGAVAVANHLTLVRITDPVDGLGDAVLVDWMPAAGIATSVDIEAPSAGVRRGGVFVTDAAGTNRPDWGNLKSWGHLTLNPPVTPMWLVDGNGPFGTLSSALTFTLTYYRRFHTYVSASS